jgi:hypothetical protein
MQATPGAEADEASLAAQPLGANPTLCHVSSQNSNVPFHVPPSPVRDALPFLLIVLIVALARAAYRAAPIGEPTLVFIPPPLRPPTPLAA